MASRSKLHGRPRATSCPRLVSAYEVAQTVLLLMRNGAITGETIHIDCEVRLV